MIFVSSITFFFKTIVLNESKNSTSVISQVVSEVNGIDKDFKALNNLELVRNLSTTEHNTQDVPELDKTNDSIEVFPIINELSTIQCDKKTVNELQNSFDKSQFKVTEKLDPSLKNKMENIGEIIYNENSTFLKSLYFILFIFLMSKCNQYLL